MHQKCSTIEAEWSTYCHSSCVPLVTQVAGTASGITAAQLDTKLPGVDLHLLEAALPAAAAARRELLEQMKAAVGQYEASLAADDAPEYGTVQIMKDLVPRLIGPQVGGRGPGISGSLCDCVSHFQEHY